MLRPAGGAPVQFSRRKRRIAFSGRCGATLSEYLVAIGVISLVLLAVLSFSLFSGRSFAGLANYTAMNSEAIVALDRMSRDIRQAVSLVGATPHRLVFNDGTNQPPLVFLYSPAERTLERQQGTNRTVLLRNCDRFQFELYRRTPLPGTYDQFRPATTNDCKIVLVRWNSSRWIWGARLNKDEAQTAKIVIRKNRVSI